VSEDQGEDSTSEQSDDSKNEEVKEEEVEEEERLFEKILTPVSTVTSSSVSATKRCGLYQYLDPLGKFCVQEKCPAYYYLRYDGLCDQVECKIGYRVD